MKVREIAEAVRRGEIELDFAGHQTNETKERFLAAFDDAVAGANGSHDGKWKTPLEGKTMEDTNLQMREHYRFPLERDVKQEEVVSFSFCSDGVYCFGCGDRIKWTLTGTKLQLRNHFVREPKNDFRGDFANYPIEYVCPFATPQPTRGEINITSKLIFANFFRGFEDAPEDDKYSDEWSINCSAGCKRVTEYKATTQNVAYGQMGNMSIGIYVNEAKDSIIVGPAYHPAESQEMSDEEFKKAIKLPVFPGYKKKKQTICLAVWRWEATDFNTLGKEKYDALKSEEYRDMVELKVPHGVWSFEHYYDTSSHENKHLYSLLQLKK